MNSQKESRPPRFCLRHLPPHINRGLPARRIYFQGLHLSCVWRPTFTLQCNTSDPLPPKTTSLISDVCVVPPYHIHSLSEAQTMNCSIAMHHQNYKESLCKAQPLDAASTP